MPAKTSSAGSAPGSRTPNIPTPGACAERSFGTDGSTRPGSLTVPLHARPSRRLLEQQSEEPAFGEPQQERDRKPQQQQRIPCRPHARLPEPASPRGRRERERASRDGHDQQEARRHFCPVHAGKQRRAAGQAPSVKSSCRSSWGRRCFARVASVPAMASSTADVEFPAEDSSLRPPATAGTSSERFEAMPVCSSCRFQSFGPVQEIQHALQDPGSRGLVHHLRAAFAGHVGFVDQQS